MGHLLSDGCHGLAAGARLTAPTPRAERAGGLEMLRQQPAIAPGSTLAAARGYDKLPFVRALEQLGLRPLIARYRGRRRSSPPQEENSNPALGGDFAAVSAGWLRLRPMLTGAAAYRPGETDRTWTNLACAATISARRLSRGATTGPAAHGAAPVPGMA